MAAGYECLMLGEEQKSKKKDSRKTCASPWNKFYLGPIPFNPYTIDTKNIENACAICTTQSLYSPNSYIK